MTHGVVPLFLMSELTLKMLQKNGYFCGFSVDMLSGKCDSFFSPTTKSIDDNIISICLRFRVCRQFLFETVDCEGR